MHLFPLRFNSPHEAVRRFLWQKLHIILIRLSINARAKGNKLGLHHGYFSLEFERLVQVQKWGDPSIVDFDRKPFLDCQNKLLFPFNFSHEDSVCWCVPDPFDVEVSIIFPWFILINNRVPYVSSFYVWKESLIWTRRLNRSGPFPGEFSYLKFENRGLNVEIPYFFTQVQVGKILNQLSFCSTLCIMKNPMLQSF